MSHVKVRTAIGQDSHRFLTTESTRPCIIGGVVCEDAPGFNANSDGDVVYHALCNALTSLHGKVIMGGEADELCLKQGITDSELYLKRALDYLGRQQITSISITLEGKRPRLKERYRAIAANVARLCQVEVTDVGVTATSGEGLTDFGCGEGVQCLCIVTTEEVMD
jgi:2-C-methyl-D-erythritol 2,4-cyclodiphosphate synthase